MGCFLPVTAARARSLGCFDSIGRRSCPVALGSRQDVVRARVLVALKIVQTSEHVTRFRSPITKGGCGSRSPRARMRLGSTLVAHGRHGLAVVQSIARARRCFR